MSVLFVTGGLKVRTLEPSDRAAVLSVYKQCEDFLSLGPVPKASREMVASDITHSAAAQGLYCVIEDLNGQTVGVVDFSCEAARGTAVLWLLMISARHRRKGYGTAIAAALESYLRDTYGVRTIESGVQVNNPMAIRFWSRCGYKIGTVPRSQADGTVAYDMTRDIGSPA